MKNCLMLVSAISGLFLLTSAAFATSTVDSSCIAGYVIIDKLGIPEDAQVRVVEVRELEQLDGVCAYVLETPSGRQVVIAGEKYFFNGRLFDFDEQIVVQDEILKEYQYIDLDDFAELKYLSALRFGSGNYEAVLVTDPECPHCEHLTQTLAEIEELSLYIAFMPLPDNAHGVDMSIRIACGQTGEINDFESYFKALNESQGNSDEETEACELYETQQRALHRIMRKNAVGLAVPKLFFRHGVYVMGEMSKEDIEEHLENSSPIIPLVDSSKVRVSKKAEQDDVISDEGETLAEGESIFDETSQNSTVQEETTVTTQEEPNRQRIQAADNGATD